MEENNQGSGQGKRHAEAVNEPWMVERAKEVLRAMGRLIEFDWEDLDTDTLREVVANIRHSQAMHNPDFSISCDTGSSARAAGEGHSLIWEEVMK